MPTKNAPSFLVFAVSALLVRAKRKSCECSKVIRQLRKWMWSMFGGGERGDNKAPRT